MKKIAFLCPSLNFTEDAKRIISEDRIENIDVLVVDNDNCVEIAMEVVRNGAEIIISRGMQAAAIKKSMSTPVVEVVITVQEMGLVILQAKKLIAKPNPHIAVVGLRSMFCDMSRFDELFDIQLETFFVDDISEIIESTRRAIQSNAELIIGGGRVCSTAREAGIPALMQPTGDIRQAIYNANNVAYAIKQEKKNTAELNTLLDFSINGLLKIDNNGIIRALNQPLELLFSIKSANLVGEHINTLIPSLFEEQIQRDALTNQQEIFTVIPLHKLVLAVSVFPILVNGGVEGAIISCHEVRKKGEPDTEPHDDLQQNETRINCYTHFFTENRAFMRTVKQYASFDSCILIVSKPGYPAKTAASIICAESIRREKPFNSFICGEWPAEQQLQLLFGDKPKAAAESLVFKSNGGTLFIGDAELIGAPAQARLYRLISEKVLVSEDEAPIAVDLRLIASTSTDLSKMLKSGQFRTDLYYAVSVLTLQLPNMDADYWASCFIQQYCSAYFRYMSLTKGARKVISEHAWEGGLAELDGFCEKLVLTTSQRILDEDYVRNLLHQDIFNRESQLQLTMHPEANRIEELLYQFGGNRAFVAEALGISKPTLWRKMKKYGLYNNASEQ